MILTVDLGNTTASIVLLEEVEPRSGRNYRVLKEAKLPTERTFTKEDYGKLLEEQVPWWSPCKMQLTRIALSSVVPELTDIWEALLEETFQKKPYRLHAKQPLGITLQVPEPDKIGVDRLCDAAYAFALEGKSVITVDLGTATTFNVVNAKGQFLGGAIAPGLWTGLHALSSHASQLSEISLSLPEHFIGRNTSECMNIGAVVGMAGVVNEIVRRMKEELGEDAMLYVTGGCAEVLCPLLSHKYQYDPHLLPRGLAYLSQLDVVK